MYHPDQVTIDGIECYLKWSKHSKEREIERLFIVEDVIRTLELATKLLDFPSGTYCWARNHTRQKSVLVRILAEKLYICIEIITLLDDIAQPQEGTKVIDVWEEEYAA